MSGGSKPIYNQFCKYAIVDLRTVGFSCILYIAMCDINMRTFDKGELALLG